MRREILYAIQSQPMTDGRPATVSEYLRRLGYSRHLMTYLRHHAGTLLVNGHPVFTSYPLSSGDVIRVVFTDDPKEEGNDRISPSPMNLDIVYEDEDILVVNKPPYLPVQPSLGHREHTLGNGVASYYEKQGLPFVYRCVNRLDKNTSGLVLIAKNMASSAILYDFMKKRQIRRIYFTVVEGKLDDFLFANAPDARDRAASSRFRNVPSPDAVPASGRAVQNWPEYPGVIDLPIARESPGSIRRIVDPAFGKRAVTHFRTESYFPPADMTSLHVRLETGRTHQIRVHMSFIGHPVAGDSLYGGSTDRISRQALHSESLDFPHPITRVPMHFECPPPKDIQSLLDLSGLARKTS